MKRTNFERVVGLATVTQEQIDSARASALELWNRKDNIVKHKR